MIARRVLALSLFLIVALSLLYVNVTRSSPATYPSIYVEPASVKDKTLVPGENFTVSIKTDYTGGNVTAWQLTMSYDPSVLNGTSVVNGDLVSVAKDATATFLPGSFDNTQGTLSLTAAFFFYIFPPPFVTSGPGTLANVTFTVVGYGVSDIILGNETQLIGWNATGSREYYIIDAEAEPDHIDHGYFSNKYPSIYVEPAIINNESLTAGENFTVSIKTDYTGGNVTAWQLTMSYDPSVLNGTSVVNGDLVSVAKDATATFLPGAFNNTEGTLSLTAAFFFYIFPPPFVTSGPGTLANVTFTVVGYGVSDIILGNETQLIGWNFTGSKEYFIIDAGAEPQLIDHGYFSNKIAGDIDGDGDVDTGDLYLFSTKFGTEEDDPDYDLHCDLDDDGDVDSDDAILFADEYGQSV